MNFHLWKTTKGIILTINGANPVLHVMIEGINENQLHSQVGVLEVLSKLQKADNLTPHAANHFVRYLVVRYSYTRDIRG